MPEAIESRWLEDELQLSQIGGLGSAKHAQHNQLSHGRGGGGSGGGRISDQKMLDWMGPLPDAMDAEFHVELTAADLKVPETVALAHWMNSPSGKVGKSFVAAANQSLGSKTDADPEAMQLFNSLRADVESSSLPNQMSLFRGFAAGSKPPIYSATDDRSVAELFASDRVGGSVRDGTFWKANLITWHGSKYWPKEEGVPSESEYIFFDRKQAAKAVKAATATEWLEGLEEEVKHAQHNQLSHGRGGGGSFTLKGSRKFNEAEFKEARTEHRKSKGTNKENNLRLVKASGVTLITSEALKDDSIEAVAHVVADKFQAKNMTKVTIKVKDLGNRYGNSSGNVLSVDASAMKESGPGFGAAIIRHEFEHTMLTRKGIPSSQQESRVRATTGQWAAIKYSGLAVTNPRAGNGLRDAARAQGVKVK